MRSTYLMLAIILTRSFSEAADINKEVLINATTNISCILKKDIHLQLEHTPLDGPAKYVYTGGSVRDPSSRGFRLENDSNTGSYHLVIPHARTEDAGLYKCREEAGSDVLYSTQLTVLESNPVCESNMKDDGYVGPNTCNIKQEDMTFTCAVSFKGEPPQMTWKIFNGWQPFSDPRCIIGNGRINCSLIITADPKYDGAIFNCQSTRSTAECSTKIIKIHYFEKQSLKVVDRNVGEKVNCSVKTNQELDYKWTLIQGDQEVNVTKEMELLIESPGLYLCSVEYRIRNVPCDTGVTYVDAKSPSKSPKEETGATAETTVIWVLSVVLLISVIGNIVSIACFCKKNRKKSTA